MQSDSKEIYRLTADRTGKSQEVYKDIGNFILHETYITLRKPKSLITKLKGVGFWFLRKKKMREMIGCYPKDYETRTEDSFDSPNTFLKYCDKREFYLLIKERLKEYERYTTKKKETKIKRNGPDNVSQSKEDSKESSQDQS